MWKVNHNGCAAYAGTSTEDRSSSASPTTSGLRSPDTSLPELTWSMVADQSTSLLERWTGTYLTNRTWVSAPDSFAPPGPVRSPTTALTSARSWPEAIASCAETCSLRTAESSSSLVSLPWMAVIG